MRRPSSRVPALIATTGVQRLVRSWWSLWRNPLCRGFQFASTASDVPESSWVVLDDASFLALMTVLLSRLSSRWDRRKHPLDQPSRF